MHKLFYVETLVSLLIFLFHVIKVRKRIAQQFFFEKILSDKISCRVYESATIIFSTAYPRN